MNLKRRKDWQTKVLKADGYCKMETGSRERRCGWQSSGLRVCSSDLRVTFSFNWKRKDSDMKIDWDAYMSQVSGFLEGERIQLFFSISTQPLSSLPEERSTQPT